MIHPISDSGVREDYRVQCELRYVADLKWKARRSYLELVAERRGAEAAEKLSRGASLLVTKRHGRPGRPASLETIKEKTHEP